MKSAKYPPTDATPGFGTRLTDTTDLGIAMLIAVDNAAGYLPVATVSTIAEGREIAQDDLRRRMQQLERGGEGPAVSIDRKPSELPSSA
jgi:hypothetical protein